MTDQNGLLRRVERLEREVGIDPDHARFAERCEDAAIPDLRLIGVDDTENMARFEARNGSVGPAALYSLDKDFEDAQIDMENNEVIVWGLNEEADDV